MQYITEPSLLALFQLNDSTHLVLHKEKRFSYALCSVTTNSALYKPEMKMKTHCIITIYGNIVYLETNKSDALIYFVFAGLYAKREREREREKRVLEFQNS